MILKVEYKRLKNAYLKINKEKVTIRLPLFLSEVEQMQILTKFLDIANSVMPKKYPVKICYKPGKEFIFVNALLGTKYKTIFTVNLETWKQLS